MTITSYLTSISSISPPEPAANFLCSLDLSELVHSLRSLEKSLVELDALRVQMKIRTLGLERYCRPLVFEKAVTKMRGDLKRMPDEILAFIFQAGHDMDRYGHYKFAVSVSHVSRHFREVALSTPRLWTRGECPLQISAFIARSRSVSALDIKASPMTRPPPDATTLSQFLDLLLPHSRRWSSLQFVDNEQLRLAFQPHTNIQLPELRHLDARYGYDFNEVTPIWANWEMRHLDNYSTLSLRKFVSTARSYGMHA
ncbi:hypothetical protein BD410DRAFT_836916 [Rickenella mellea]|uniref:Uncharacterized protein n=1 Tax=Rickenella mellea TaxID=50990 RepID=A0A4Y7QFS9_9AGAM|nr:hypothetical protein BD410DRAFT_836916 [Rickenella mellea]